MQGNSLTDSLHSIRNQLLWELRSRLRWRREGYIETGAEELSLSKEETRLEQAYDFYIYRPYLSAENYRKNLWTLLLLENFLKKHLRPTNPLQEVIEPGCQDFSRLPGLRSFLRRQGKRGRITGLELDPFPLLHDFHSRWDKAKYYLNCTGSSDPIADRYLEADFFRWNEQADLICCFYPFVSRHPALAWGLPAQFGNPKPWIESFCRNLQPDGLLLVVHQGSWEEEDFDEVRKGSPLRLLQRDEFRCDFYSLPYPACVSVYRKEL